jgi:hypothetical protein
MCEPWNSLALVLVGSVLGAWAFGAWCGCVCRLRWKRSWRGLAQRNGRAFYEGGHTARFLAEAAHRRSEEKAARLKEVAK